MASFSGISQVTEVSHYETLVKEKSHVVVFFWAEWHEPSKLGGQMDSVFSGLSSRYSNISFAKIEAENENTALVAEKLGVSVVPTFVCVLSGKIWNKLEGANPTGTVISNHSLVFFNTC